MSVSLQCDTFVVSLADAPSAADGRESMLADALLWEEPKVSPRAGGEADKFGNRYEGIWTVLQLLYILNGDVHSITVEDIGDLGQGAEFILRRRDTTEAHQLKRQHGNANSWTVKSLHQEGVWNNARLHVEAGRQFVFVSIIPASPLQELADRARRSENLTAFVDSWLNKKLRESFDELASSAIFGSTDVAWTALRGIQFRCIDEGEVIHMASALAGLLLEGAEGRLAIAGLGDLVQHNLGAALDAPLIEAKLAEYGLRRAKHSLDTTLSERVRSITTGWKESLERQLLQPVIERPEADDVGLLLMGDSRLVCLLGPAGGGKSAIVLDAVSRLDADVSDVLAFRIDRLEPFNSTVELGRQLDLGVSPVAALAAVAKNRRAILVIDQVDAVSLVSGRMPRSFDTIADLIRESAAFPNMCVLLACRKFDYEHDHRIRDLVNATASDQVAASDLSESQIVEAVKSMGLDASRLTTKQKTLLQSPLNLVLLRSVADETKALSFQTTKSLFDAFWRRKQSECRLRRDGVRFADVLMKLAEAISTRQRLSVSESIFDIGDLSVDADILVSEHVLTRDSDQVAFFHETFFDYVFARGWMAKNESLIDFLAGGEQELFRRAQVRQILNHIREQDPERFTREVESLLTSAKIRFHLKDVVIAILSELADPTSSEWFMIQRVLDTNPDFADRLWLVIRSEPWFERLDGEGLISAWLGHSEASNVSHALDVMVSAVKAAPDRVAELLKPHARQTEAYPQWLQWVVRFSNLFDSRALFDLVLDAVRSGQYGSNVDELWMSVHGLGQRQPGWAVELLDAYLVDRPGAMSLDSSGAIAALKDREHDVVDLVRHAAEGAPKEFVERLVPYMLLVMDLTTYGTEPPLQDQHFSHRYANHEPYDLGDALVVGMGAAFRRIAEDDLLLLRPVLETLAADRHEAAQWLLYEAFRTAGAELADWASEILLEGKHRFLSGNSESSVWSARLVLQVINSHISDDVFAQLERAAIELQFSWETRKSRGWYSFSILSALDELRLSEAGRRRLGELRRFFSINQPPPPRGARGGTIGSPISQDAIQHMNDGQWLGAIVKHGSDKTDWDKETGGARELSHVLKEEVVKSPRRFALLALNFDANTHVAYADAILLGLADAQQLSDPEPIFDAVRHIAALGNSSNDRWLGSALRKYLKSEMPIDLAELILARALRSVDPVDDALSIRSDRPDRAAEDIYTSGVNSGRGQSALTIGDWLVYDTDGSRSELVSRHLGQLAGDAAIAVRSCVAHVIAASLRHNRLQAVSAFNRLVEADDLLLATHTVERLMMYIGNTESSVVLPVIERMVSSNESVTREAGGRLAALGGLEWGLRGLFDAAVQTGDASVRKGMAQVCARHLPASSDAQLAGEYVIKFANDGDSGVRGAASQVAVALRGERLRKYEAVLIKLMESPAFDQARPQLIITLEYAPDRVDDLVLRCARRFVDANLAEVGDIRTSAASDARGISELVVRAYAQAQDVAGRGAALDLIDDLLRYGAYGVNELLDDTERR
ncbi:hypothetical protein [Actinokineospora sp. HUAS TT18]|uniref:hypothetical protein n=1 Tax=Actinokineospora sp. HUAS TT18 TaxID=3447451 RepID=UPI003F5285F8